MDLTQLKTRPDTLISSQSRTVFWANQDGWITGENGGGFYVHETRLLSRYCWRINGEPYTVEAANIRQNSHLCYYITEPRALRNEYVSAKVGPRLARNATEETVELLIGTVVSDGFHQDIELANYSQQRQSVRVEVLYDADFADMDEAIGGKRHQRGRRTVKASKSEGEARLQWRYVAKHKGRAIDRGLELIFRGICGRVKVDSERLRVDLVLQPGERVHWCVDAVAHIDGRELRPVNSCYEYHGGKNQRYGRKRLYLEESARVTMTHPRQWYLQCAIERARHDLTALRLFDLDRGANTWIPAAGVPLYPTVFGRDTVTTAVQSALISPAILRGGLEVLGELQGTRDNPWRDEEPGKMIHETHTGPLSALDLKPQGRYYGAFTTTPFYVIMLSEFYHWTGDKQAVLRYLPAARAALDWINRYGDVDGDGFYEYRTRSSQGVKNQAWKDSGDAMVDVDGSIVPNPIGTCEMQGSVYEAKLRMAELLWVTGERLEAAKSLRAAQELKKRFNDKFWMPEANFFAMAIGPKRRLVRTIASNPGDTLASGIIDASLAKATVDRLFQPDLFTGWGIRTLSSDHPAFDPYSYHRGSVWPSENAGIAVGLRRYEFTERLKQLVEAMLDVAMIFDQERLPEVITGHQRDERHPFPAVYPQACAPQAWSAGAVLMMLQMMLGIYPYAPLETLFVNPALPSWVPELEIHNVQVGTARISMRFERQASGETKYEVIDQRGKLRLIRQPSPWSVFAGPLDRVKDLIESLAA